MGDLDKAEQAFQQALGIKADFVAATANLDSVRKKRAELAAAPPANTANAGGRPRSLGAKFSAANFPAIGIKGLLVESVTTNGAAAAAGLRKGDLVLLLDGREVTSPEQLQTYVTSGTRAHDPDSRPAARRPARSASRSESAEGGPALRRDDHQRRQGVTSTVAR